MTAPAEPHLEAMGRWVAQLSIDRIPPRALRAAKCQLLDMAAAVHAAARASDVRCVVEGARGFSGGGRATVLATGERLGPTDAALINAACSMAQDFDDIVWMGHTCHSAVFASLAVAEHEGADTRALLVAIVAANEVAGRLGASSFFGPLNGQMWTFIHLIGAAAATAKLLGLTAERTAHALAIALAQPTFALQPGFLSPTSKLLAAATPTATGIQAAYFARAGMTGALSILEAPRGFWSRFSFAPLPFMLEGLGETWVLDTLTLKSFPGCHYFQTALAAIERLRARLGPLTLARVRRVGIDTTLLACEASRFAREASGDVTPVTVCFDLAQAASVLLVAGALGPEQLEPAWLAAHRPELDAWRARTQVRHDPLLSAKVIAGARRLSGGRRAVAGLSLRQLAGLRRRYAEEYRSTLFRWSDAVAALRGSLQRDAPDEPDAGGVPLYFPARVTLALDGGTVSERLDLPRGSIASPGFHAELEKKVLRELPPSALELGLAAEAQPLEALVRVLRPPDGPGPAARMARATPAARTARRTSHSGTRGSPRR